MPFSRAAAIRSSIDSRSRRIVSRSGSPDLMIITGVPWVSGRQRAQRPLTQEMTMVSSAKTLMASTPDVIE
jgi:hypothetical protein